MVGVRNFFRELADGLKKFADNFMWGLEILACKMGHHTIDTFGENVGKNKYTPILIVRCEHCEKVGFVSPTAPMQTWVKGDIEKLPDSYKKLIDPDWMEGYRFAKENR